MLVKIALDNRVLINTGIHKYTQKLLSYLPHYITDLEIVEYNDPSYFKRFNKYGKVSLRMFDEVFLMKSKLKQNSIDLFHCTKNYGIPNIKVIPIITTIHDIIPLVMKQFYMQNPIQYAYYKYHLHYAIRKSKLIITSSEFSKRELIKYFPELKNKIQVIYIGCEQNLFVNNTSEKENINYLRNLNITRPYVLTMGGAEPRKNVQILCDLFASNAEKLKLDLVVVGNKWKDKELKIPSNSKNIHVCTNISEQALKALYKQSSFFIFPSIYEGFGLPLLEAMSFGAPVIAHNGSCMPEITGQAAYLVDMNDSNQIQKAIINLRDSTALAYELREQGFERIKKFTWDKTAKQTAELYKSLYKI